MATRETNQKPRRIARTATIGLAVLLAVAAEPAAATLHEPAPQAETAAISINDGIFTAAQVARGRSAYAELCTQCQSDPLHGTALEHDLTGSAFLATWEGQTVASFLTWIKTEMPLRRSGAIDQTTYANLAAFILRENGYPTGEAELDLTDEKWATVTIVSPER